jgi:hypothetical protein
MRRNFTELVKKQDESYDEIKELNFFEYFNSFYNAYVDYIESLTPDKIVCVFNIILGFLTLSSFVSILSIMLSESIIKKIKIFIEIP